MLFGQVHCAPIQHYQIFTRSCYLAKCTLHQYITKSLTDHAIWPSALCTNTTLPNLYQIMLFGHVHCAPIQHYQIFSRPCYLAMCTVHQYNITKSLTDHAIWPWTLCINTLPNLYQIMLFGHVHCAPIQHYQIFTRSCYLAIGTMHQYNITKSLPDHVLWEHESAGNCCICHCSSKRRHCHCPVQTLLFLDCGEYQILPPDCTVSCRDATRWVFACPCSPTRGLQIEQFITIY